MDRGKLLCHSKEAVEASMSQLTNLPTDISEITSVPLLDIKRGNNALREEILAAVMS